MKRVFRVGAVLAMSILFASSSFAGDSAKPKAKEKKSDTASAETASSPAAAKPVPEPQKQQKKAAKSPAKASAEAPKWIPMPATNGALGLFTVETGDTLPTKGFSFSTYVNKFSRAPGSISVLNLGWNFGVGLRDWLTLYVDFEPYRHIHVGVPSQLSLNSPITNPAFPNTVNPTIYRSLNNIPGTRPAYVEDYPFAFSNDGGVGELAVGFKVGVLSERRGRAVSLSVSNDFIFPTRTFLTDLLDNTTQSGQFSYGFTIALSKTFGRVATVTSNSGYRFTRDPRSAGKHLMNMADQFRLGAGILLNPQGRIQPMIEATGIVFNGTATPNTTFGARDPVDGVFGARLYPWRSVAVDLGYRYMLNLGDVNDRHGFVIKLGVASWPENAPPPNRPPVASCSAEKSSVYTGSSDVVTVRVQASDPDGDPLTYNWTATGGRVDGSGTEVRWNSAGTAAGTYTINVRVDDGRGGTASCGVDVKVEPRPNRPPTMTCSAERSSVLIGERVRINAVASDPDGDPLTYGWRTNGGQIVGSGASVQLDTTGLSAGRYTVTGRVDDGRGGAADCSTSVDVQAPPPPPQASKINECNFRTGSGRVDNVCKRILDDVALRLKNEPRATVVIVGYADPAEPRAAKLAQQRGDNTVKYLGEKGIDQSRATVRTATGQKGADKANRRIDVIFVPEGATY
jgi:outer membrane protein OmpA-like peptidoglycan-associated protein